ncbi:MAG: arsenate reductase ArsC [Candidatus Marsarchaeota archaeon]|nr:arsenate reductase ArsC [Candidatus Marsarchaeota archaeon]
MRVLFVCIHNACRSQMSEALFNRMAPPHQAFSAGSKPAAQIDPKTVEVMKEAGMDISGKVPRSTEHYRGQKFDYVITMGCGDACPYVAAKHRIDWQIPDPKGKPIEEYRKVRDMLEAKIKGILDEMEKTESG